jgi:hypothetical protein
MARS